MSRNNQEQKKIDSTNEDQKLELETEFSGTIEKQHQEQNNEDIEDLEISKSQQSLELSYNAQEADRKKVLIYYLKKSVNDCKKYFRNVCNQNQYLPLRYQDQKNTDTFKFKLVFLYCVMKMMCIDGFKIFKEYLLGPFLMLFSYYIFQYKIVKGCGEIDRIEVCIEKIIVQNIVTVLIQVFIVASMTYSLMYMCYKKVISRNFMIPFIIGSLFVCLIQHDMAIGSQQLEYFGGAIIYFIIIFNLLIAMMHRVVSFFYKMYNRNFKRFLLVVASIFVIYLIILEKLKGTCSEWDNGIAGYIEYDEVHCELLKPLICWQTAMDKWFLFDSSCKINDLNDAKLNMLKLYHKIDNKKQSKEQIKQIMQKNNFMAYPFTNQFSAEDKDQDYPTQQAIINQALFTETYEEAKKSGREAIVNLNNMKLEFQMERDEKLVQFRKEIYNQKQHMAKNVILIYIDTLSRPQAHRKLPKTMEFLSQFSDYDKKNRAYTKDADEKAKLYEFFRFHSIDKKTRNHNLKLQYNQTWVEQDDFPSFEEKKPNLINEFKKRGYITGHAANTCTSLCNFRSIQYQPYKQYFFEDYGDHEFLMYDPQYIDPENYYNLNQGINSILRRCIYNTDTSEHVFKYGELFLQKYRDDPKYLFMEFTDSHEMTSEIVSYLDDHLYQFLVNIKQMGYFEKETNIMLVSDHGQHIITSFIYRPPNTYLDPTNSFFQIERLLPLFMSIMTKDILNNYPSLDETMFQNQQKLMSMQQVRNTAISSADEYNNAIYFQDSVYYNRPKEFQCPNLPFAGVDPIKWCVCKNPNKEEARQFQEEYLKQKQIEKQMKELQDQQQQDQLLQKGV